MKYTHDETTVTPPSIELKTIGSDFTQILSNSGSSILASLQSLRLPQLITIPSNPSPTQEPLITQESPTPQDWNSEPTSTPAFVAPTDDPLPPIQQPTTADPRPTQPPIATSVPKPTAIPKPTKVPKPTKPPLPPPVTSDVRPGASIEEMLKDVEKRMCVPYKLLMAVRKIESGAWFNNLTSTSMKFYNTYGWWKTAGVGEICAGLAYYTQTGIIPPDSVNASSGSCSNAGLGAGQADQKIMGLFQVSEQEEKVSRKNTTRDLPKSIDRRVLFDNAIIFASITKNRVGSLPPSCEDWPEDAVKTVAEKHYGACAYPGGNYCNEVWNFYKTLK